MESAPVPPDVTPLLYESHSHTPLCQHAVGEPVEYAAHAERRGLKGIIFTCHCPLPNGMSAGVRMAPEQFNDYVRLIERTRTTWAGRVDVRLGLESDFLPGLEPWLEKLHARVPLHHVLGSVHPQIPEYRARFYGMETWLERQRIYFDLLAQSAESGLYDTLAHPDLVKNEAPEEWVLERIMPDILRALDRIAATGVAMELNTSGVNKTISEVNPGPQILAQIHARQIPVVLGADAHRPTRVADGYEAALRLLAEIGFREIQFFLDRQPHRLSIPQALASLRADPAPPVEFSP